MMNCWEAKKCGREEGGSNAVELGICPAFIARGTDCARVAGVLCGGKIWMGAESSELHELVFPGTSRARTRVTTSKVTPELARVL